MIIQTYGYAWPEMPPRDVDGEELVKLAIYKEEDLQRQLQKLAEIVGRLVDKLPEEARLEVCGLQYTHERVRKREHL